MQGVTGGCLRWEEGIARVVAVWGTGVLSVAEPCICQFYQPSQGEADTLLSGSCRPQPGFCTLSPPCCGSPHP